MLTFLILFPICMFVKFQKYVLSLSEEREFVPVQPGPFNLYVPKGTWLLSGQREKNI